jgi:hypothetical protein
MNQYIEQSYQRAARAMRPPLIHVDNLADASASSYASPVHYSNFDGSKFVGGFGATELLNFDYWTLRARSIELFGIRPHKKLSCTIKNPFLITL